MHAPHSPLDGSPSMLHLAGCPITVEDAARLVERLYEDAHPTRRLKHDVELPEGCSAVAFAFVGLWRYQVELRRCHLERI